MPGEVCVMDKILKDAIMEISELINESAGIYRLNKTYGRNPTWDRLNEDHRLDKFYKAKDMVEQYESN